MKALIEDIACAFPATRVSNRDLRVDHPDWDFNRLEERTGVFERHIASPGETALDFAVQAWGQIMAEGRFSADEIDAVIFCTQTPDFIITPNACLLHGCLGLRPEVLAFDTNLACSGYIYGLQIAQSLIQSGAARLVLLATGDTYSRLIHPGDRSTRCLFGDGGAVSIIGPSQDDRGILDISCGTAGKEYKRFLISAGGMRHPRSEETAAEVRDQSGNIRTAEHITMDGLGVLSFFNATIPREVEKIMRRNGLTASDIDLFIFHQASQVVLDSLRRLLKLPEEKVVYDLSDVGNLVSAAIPVALSRAMAVGRARPGQLLLLCGFGAGLSWGTALVRL